ncbi:uncharacterized protein Z519_07663 [Cladophialophora bantiana CBS 173.52]|uniref:Xylanolytic transcriptional activator regulatory domain-containing protein n=1 Tax=Cladophialophora bantiana (strain ATCC 10958 / CBS 173.52 / CDC B-1940 / NIH 8579) TaxID=1442370 RepID=A0A0D2HLN5_CLAB1|nr:uncharacterized protein Z519_07663 [Cladophialophora bantiana CBS 173.52]KIW91695.1 hypothetical protein Z519_07663 [Cladophialophora bantiana CBS 173.52]
MQALYFDTSPQLQSSSRPAFQRARAACQACRTKKVRCNASDGVRCSNSSRKTKTSRRILSAVPSAPKEPPVAIDGDGQLAAPRHDEIQRTGSYEPRELVDDERSRLGSEPLELPWAIGGPQHRQIYSHTVRSLSPLHSLSDRRAPIIDLPSYIKPQPPSLGADDIEYLQKKGAFVLPDPALRDECLRCYILYVHPLYPTVDYTQVWSIVHKTPAGRGRLSLLLLQALIFAGSMWADVRLVRRAGFLSRKAFRNSLNQRIRVLYDADYEDDQLTLVQSLLLWSFWWKGANGHKDGYHWVGVAYSIARSIDLHHPTTDNGSNRAPQHLRRQLWWAICNREVIGSHSMGREPRFKDADHTVPILGLDDFDYGKMMSEAPSDMPRATEAQYLDLARITVEFVKLNKIFSKILGVVCHENSVNRTTMLYSAQQMKGSNSVSSTKGRLNIDDLIECDRELTRWRQQVPENLWHTGPLPFSPPEWRKAELSHRAILSMMYHMALMTVHRPQVLPLESAAPSPTGTSERNRRHISRVRQRHSAQEITSIAMDFFNADLLTFLPATVVSCLMPVSILHTLDIFSDDVRIRTEATRQLDECRAMLYTLAERQFAPEWVLQTVEHLLSRAKQCEGSKGASRLMQRAPSDAESHPARYEDRDRVPSNDRSNNEFEQIEQPTAATIANPDAGQLEWESCLVNPEGWSDFQIPALSGRPFPTDIGSSEALEESWLDFARVSGAMPGSNRLIGHF